MITGSRDSERNVYAIIPACLSRVMPPPAPLLSLTGRHYDSLFQQQFEPPVRELLDVRPDELWVIRMNPQRRDSEPTTLAEIAGGLAK
jgi:hypothetical protein